MESIRDLARMRSDRKGAGQLLREGRFAEAEEAFSACVAARPRDATSLLGLGYVALLRNDLAAAETRLRAALDLKPRLKAARALLGELFYRRDDFGQAAPFFDAVGRAAMARKLASFAGQQPNEIDGASSITLIPFVRTDPLPVIELCVDGSGPARFLIDTGGGELILDRELANSVAAARFGAERSYFGGGKKAAFEHARVDSVVLGDLVMRNVPVIVMDLKELGPVVAEERLDGIVGTVPLYHFRSTIDYPSGRLVLERRVEGRPSHGPDATTDGKVALPFWLAGDHLMVAWGAVNGGRQTLLFVDTASPARASRVQPRRSERRESRSRKSSPVRAWAEAAPSDVSRSSSTSSASVISVSGASMESPARFRQSSSGSSAFGSAD